MIGAITLFAPAAHHPLYRFVEIPATVLATVVLIYAGYSNASGPVHRLLSHRWLAGIGRASYSLYLWHVVPMLLLENVELPKPVLGLMSVAITLVLTFISYHLLEKPFLRPRSDVLHPVREPARQPQPNAG